MTRAIDTIQTRTSARRGLSRFVPNLGRLSRPSSLMESFLLWQARARERYHLQELDDHLLRDMGLSRADIAREADKPFWRP